MQFTLLLACNTHKYKQSCRVQYQSTGILALSLVNARLQASSIAPTGSNKA